MTCKYKYKDNWYSKDEIKKILLKERGINSKGELIKPTITNNPKQAKITKENTTSIKSVLDNYNKNDRYIPSGDVGYVAKDDLGNITSIFDDIKKAENQVKLWQETNPNDGWRVEKVNKLKEKEYTSQALTNLKIATLKEVARKYPRSLITSKVVPINPNLVNNSEIQYSKVGSKQDIQEFKEFVQGKHNSIKPGVSEIFESNPELANSVYESLGFSQKDDFKQTFKNSLWRGQEGQPYINENGDLVLTPTYDTLFKSEGISFAENLAMAQEYGKRYSKNPFIVEINEDYADTIYPLDRKGKSQDYGKRVVGDEREQRFISKKGIIIPKGKFKIHRKELNLDLSDVKTSVLLRKYQEQFTEGDVAEYSRYGEIAKGYATEDPLVFQEVEKELLKRGVTKEDLPFLVQNQLNGLEYNVAEALGKTKEFTDNFTGKKINLPDESSVTQKDIDFYLSKIKEVEGKLENKGIKNEISVESNNKITPQQKQQAQQLYSSYLNTIFPDSKVKDIVYRGGNLGTKQPQDVEAFTTNKSYAEYRAEQNNTKVFPAILNIKESNLLDKKETRTLSLDRDEFQYQDYGFTDNKDQTKQLGNFYTVKETNRHILGSKQDIEGFKKFMGKSDDLFEKSEDFTEEEILERLNHCK